jgi:hypothetical protein
MRLHLSDDAGLIFGIDAEMFDYLLNHSTTVVVETHEDEFLADGFEYGVPLFEGAHIEEDLDDVVSKLVVGQLGDLRGDGLEDLTVEEFVVVVQGVLDVARAVLIPAPLAHVSQVAQNLLFLPKHR